MPIQTAVTFSMETGAMGTGGSNNQFEMPNELAEFFGNQTRTDEVMTIQGLIPKSGQAAVRLECFFLDGCVDSSSPSSSAFNSAKHSGGSQSQSVRRSFAIASRVRSSRSSHRPDNTAARSWSTASAFPSSQNRLVPFSRRLSTRRIVLSIAPLPSGTPRHRKQSYRSRPASECRIK